MATFARLRSACPARWLLSRTAAAAAAGATFSYLRRDTLSQCSPAGGNHVPAALGSAPTISAALPVRELEPGLHYYQPDQTHPLVQCIAKVSRWYTPAFSPKDVPAFYDLSGISEDPKAFQATVDIFVNRYREQTQRGEGPTVIVGYDARGFVLGPPIALALEIPFVLLRKAGKNPGALVNSSAYSKEYAEHQPDKMCVRVGAITPADRVVLIDDLIATGGTAISGFELCSAIGCTVHEFAAIYEIPDLGPDFESPHPGVKNIRKWNGGKFKGTPIFCVMGSHTIHAARPTADDPAGWEEASKNVDMADAAAVLAKYPDMARE